MFQLQRLRISNICQYSEIEYDIPAGVSAVTAPNGFGKSNLLRALAYGLTGMVDGSWGTQQNLQKDGTVVPGFVEVWFASDTAQYKIKRFSTSSVKMQDEVYEITPDGLKEIAIKRKSVDAFMETVFGIPVPLFFQIFWGRQGELDTLLTSPAAIVNTFLSSMFDMTRLEKLRAILADKTGKIANIQSGGTESALAADKELAALPDSIELACRREAFIAQVKELEKTVEALSTAVAQGIPETTKQQQLADIDSKITALSAELARSRPTPPEAPKPELSEEDLRGMRQLTESELRVLRSDDTGLSMRESALTSDIKALALERAKWKNLRDKLEAIQQSSPATCELCGSHVQDPEDYRKKSIRMATGCESAQDYIEKETAALDALQKREQALSDQLNAIPAERAATRGKMAAAEETLSLTDAIMAVWASYALYDASIATFAEKEKRLVAMRVDRNRIDAQQTVSSDTIASYNATKNQLAGARAAEQALNKQIAETDASRKYLLNVKADAEALQERFDVNNQARSLLMELRDMFSQKRGQARYLEGMIRKLNEAIQFYMDGAKMPFTLFLHPEEHVFQYKTADGFIHPAGRLSGAQKSISSIVLQLAVVRMIHPRMSLFLMDEPAEALDAQNKRIMGDLFASLNRSLPTQGGRLLVITRDEQLIQCCDYIIDLTERVG